MQKCISKIFTNKFFICFTAFISLTKHLHRSFSLIRESSETNNGTLNAWFMSDRKGMDKCNLESNHSNQTLQTNVVE